MIYFMQPADGGPIKIGYSVNVEVRRRQLEREFGRPLAILATLDGGHQEEQELHARFDHLRFGNSEQFRPGRDLMEFIGRPLLVDPNPETVEAMPQGTAVKIDRAIASMAKAIAAHEGSTVAAVLSEAARPAIERRYAAMLRKLEGGAN